MINQNEVIKLHKEGYNSSQIAKIMEVGRKAVYRCLKKNGLHSHNIKPLNPRKVLEDQINQAIELYMAGNTLKEIPELLSLDCTSDALRGLLKRRGIELRHRGRQIRFDENYFEIIDSQDKAYWIGFIYADGNITGNRLRVEVQEQDAEIIHNLRTSLHGSNKIIEVKTDLKNNVAIGFCSVKLTSDLKAYGVVPNKTFQLKSIPSIPNELIRHFIRGYFDGDGSVYINSKHGSLRISFFGTKELLLDIQKYLGEKAGMSINKLYEKVGCWMLSYSKKKDIQSFYDYVYQDANLFLTRKKSKFESKL